MTTPNTPPPTPPQPRARSLWPATVLMCVVIACVTFLAYKKLDTNFLVVLAVGSMLPLLVQLYGIASETKSQTNGNLSMLHSLLRDALDRLYAATPAQAPPLLPSSAPPAEPTPPAEPAASSSPS